MTVEPTGVLRRRVAATPGPYLRSVAVRLFSPLLVTLILASGAAAQSWQPTDFSEPFPASGTRVCAEGSERICLGLFCHSPGSGLLLGYLDTQYHHSVMGAEITLNVDDPMAAGNMLGGVQPTAMVRRVGPYPYLYAVGAIEPDQARPVLEALKRGTTVYVTVDSETYGLQLRGSAREIARIEAVCGPPARPKAAVTPDFVADAPGPPLRLAEATAAAPAALPPGSPVPSSQALEVGAARWVPIPPDPAEDVFGTQLCHPARPGTEPLRCLRLLCFVQGDTLSLFYVDFGTPGDVFQPGQPWPTVLSDASGRSAALEFSVAGDSRELIAVGKTDPDAWPAMAAILSGSAVRIDTPHGAAQVAASGFDAEIARVAETCKVPATSEAADLPAPARVRVVFGPNEREATDAVTLRLVDEAHGASIAEYRETVGQELSGFSARAFHINEDDALLATMLCGGAWFGESGCRVSLDYRHRGRWSNVFSDGTIAYGGTIDLDATRARDGWPMIVINGSAPIWEWNGTTYRVTR